MHPEATTCEQEDLRAQSGVLSVVLSEHPTLLTAAEITRQVGSDDAHDRALTDLVAVELLRREGETVFPTRAALHFDLLV